MNGALSGRVWVVAVPGRQASGLLCLCGDAQGPLGLSHTFLRTACGVGISTVPPNLVPRTEVGSSRCWRGAELV